MTNVKQMLPDVRAFIDAREAASTAYRSAMEGVEEQFPKRYDYHSDDGREQRRKYSAAREAAAGVEHKAQEEAWEKLAESADPLVRWIAQNCDEYRGEAQTVLRTLPATLDELDELAMERDWCGTWAGFRDQAIAAGVVSGVKPLSEARKAVLDGIDAVACCRLDGGARTRVNKLLDAFLEAETKAQPAAA